MRKVIKFRPYIFLIFSCIFIFIGCNNDELNEDLPNESSNENIIGSSFEKYQQLNLDEVSGFVREMKTSKPLEYGSGLSTLNSDSKFLVDIDTSSLSFLQVEDTELKIPTLKASLKYIDIESTLFLIKVEDSMRGYLLNTIADANINNEHFSGSMIISDLSGNFINGYRIEANEFVSRYVLKNTKSSNELGVKSENKNSFDVITRYVPKITAWDLDEVTVTGKRRGGSGFISSRGLNLRPGRKGRKARTFVGRFGRSGGLGSGSNTVNRNDRTTARVFPCDDPLHGCKNKYEEEDSLENFLNQDVWDEQNPYDRWNELTKCEKDFFRTNPHHLYNAKLNRSEAEDAAHNRFGNCNNGSDHPLHNTIGDAYRHAYFSALNTQIMGYSNAKTLGDAHECEVPISELNEKKMDLHNNAWGYHYGSTVSVVNERQFHNSFMDALNKGQIKIIQECQ